MELKIRFLYGDSQSYETIVDGQNSISSIKSLISPHIQLESDLQKWVYKGKILTEQQETLAFYDFRDGDTIHIIKSISKQSPSSSAPTSFHQQTPVTYPVPYFDQAMGSYLNRNPNEENVKNCLSTISKILSNIIDHPHEEKYRRIKNTNQHFHKKVGSQEGSQQLLQSLGFQLQGEEWILHPNAETWNTIVTCQQKLTKFLEKLKSTPTTSSLPSHSPSPSSVSPSKDPGPTASPPSPPLPSPSASQQDPSQPSLDPQTLIALQSLASLLSLQSTFPSTPQSASDSTPAPPQTAGDDQTKDSKKSPSSPSSPSRG